jgi:hypothetical protein
MPMEKLCGHHEDNPSGMFLMIPTMVGKQKAAVLPDPVCAQAIRSLPARKIRMACFCTGMGFTYCHASSDVV